MLCWAYWAFSCFWVVLLRIFTITTETWRDMLECYKDSIPGHAFKSISEITWQCDFAAACSWILKIFFLLLGFSHDLLLDYFSMHLMLFRHVMYQENQWGVLTVSLVWADGWCCMSAGWLEWLSSVFQSIIWSWDVRESDLDFNLVKTDLRNWRIVGRRGDVCLFMIVYASHE